MGKISLQMWTMRDETGTIEGLERTLEKLSKIGFDTIQYSIPANYDRKIVYEIFKKHHMANDSVYAGELENMKDILDQCENFETKYLRIDGIPKELATTEDGYKEYAKALNSKASEAKRHGLKVMYHFHTFEFIKFGDKKGIDILMEETDPEVIQIIPDTHWIHCAGMNVADFLIQYKERYEFVHFKDIKVVARDETMNPRPLVYAPVGEGNLNWAPIIKVCKENNVLSYAIEQDDLYGKDPFSEVKLSFDYMVSKGL